MSDKPGMTREYFFILEYASNLMSLYDMPLHEDAPFSRQERDDQVNRFTVTSPPTKSTRHQPSHHQEVESSPAKL